MTYDEAKHRTSESYYGIDGEIALMENRYSRIDREYDEKGNVTKETYYDITGEVAKNNAGQIVVEKVYDDMNNQIGRASCRERVCLYV